MLNTQVHPSSIRGIKRLANQIKKAHGIPLHQALALASRKASFQNYTDAHRTLKDAAAGSIKHQLFLTIYWFERKPYAIGRETLEMALTTPLAELCSKAQLKRVPGLGNMRLVAPDHLVMDSLGQSQESARTQLCKAARALSFMEATGLKPCPYDIARVATQGLNEELPQKDHTSQWHDPATGQYVLIDEPYGNAVVSQERAEWATQNNWHLEASTWPGIYYPGACGFYIASPAGQGYDFDRLIRVINAIPEPVLADNWPGISAANHEVFVSPMAATPQDRRRAQAKGTIMRLPSKTTLPYSSGSMNRRPNGSMPVDGHVEAGRMIKAILQSRFKPWAVNKRMDSIRSTLEDWLGLEIHPDRLPGREFFDVYYHGLDESDPYVVATQSTQGVIDLLMKLKESLQNSYPDCAPLRKLTGKVETSVRIIERGR